MADHISGVGGHKAQIGRIKLQPREAGIKPVSGHQFGMSAFLDNAPLIHYHDAVSR